MAIMLPFANCSATQAVSILNSQESKRFILPSLDHAEVLEMCIRDRLTGGQVCFSRAHFLHFFSILSIFNSQESNRFILPSLDHAEVLELLLDCFFLIGRALDVYKRQDLCCPGYS